MNREMTPIGDGCCIDYIEDLPRARSKILYVKEDNEKRPQIGIIRSLGKGFRAFKTNKLINFDFEIGDTVLFGQYSAKNKDNKNQKPEFGIYRQRDLIAKIDLKSIGWKEGDPITLRDIPLKAITCCGQFLLFQAEFDRIYSKEIYIPKTNQKRSHIAIVKKVGKGHQNWESGIFEPTTLKENDKVLISGGSGALFKFKDGEDLWWQEQKDCLAKIEEE